MPGRWCVRHSSNRYTATHILLRYLWFRPYTQIARNLDARPRLLISIVISALVFILLRSGCVGQPVIITWDSGVICFLALACHDEPCYYQKMRRSARAQDEGRLAVLTPSCSLGLYQSLAIGFMLKDNKVPATILTLHNAFGVTVICS